MAFPIPGQTNDVPLLMELAVTRNDSEHVIDIANSSNESTSSSSHSSGLELQDESSTRTRVPECQPQLLSGGSNSRDSSLIRRGDSRGRQRRPPLFSGLLISVDLLFTLSQILAAVIVLSLAKHERPWAPLRAWIVGYGSGCLVIIFVLCLKFKYWSEQDTSQTRRQENINGIPDARGKLFSAIMILTLALECFFAVWFVVGNIWVFGWHASSAEAPNLYRLCIVFLAFSCIGFAMRFLMCTLICCCTIIALPVLVEDFSRNRGATQESIDSLPTYKFKLKKSGNEKDNSSGEGGIVAAGTEKERTISGEDAVCCICLAEYANEDELRELTCSHLFHKECVDKWLKINASCPLCKAEVGEKVLPEATAIV